MLRDMHRAFLFFPGDRLSSAELCAARLDGHVVEVGDAYAPADTVETAALRGASMLPLLGGTLAATHLSAAWVLGALPEPPARHTVQRASERRPHSAFEVRVQYRDLQVPDVDLVLIGGARVTTPERTLADLARIDDAEHRRAFELLADAEPGLAAAALDWLDGQGPIWAKRSGREILRARVQDEVTRYTS
jgi:hypothetical protein